MLEMTKKKIPKKWFWISWESGYPAVIKQNIPGFTKMSFYEEKKIIMTQEEHDVKKKYNNYTNAKMHYCDNAKANLQLKKKTTTKYSTKTTDLSHLFICII